MDSTAKTFGLLRSGAKEQSPAIMSAQHSSVAALIFAGLALASFLIGFGLREDGSGGARFDYFHHHLPTIERFVSEPWSVAIRDYPSPATPLFYILASINPLLGNELLFSIFHTVMAVGIAVLFAYALHARFAAFHAQWPWALLAGAAILLSPYFRAAAYWPQTDDLPFLFVILTYLCLFPLLDNEKPSSLNPSLLIPVVAVVSACAFYTRQFYLFLPIFSFAVLFIFYPTQRILTVVSFAAATIPGIILLLTWQGVSPPFDREKVGFSPNSLVDGFSFGMFYAIPFFCYRSYAWLTGGSGKLPLPRRSTALLLGAGYLLFLAIFLPHFTFPELAGGVLGKLCERAGPLGPLLFVTAAYCGLLIVANLMLFTSWQTRLLIGLVFVPFLIRPIVYQRYFDPLLLVLFMLFYNRRYVARYANHRAAFSVAGFNVALLIAAIGYYHASGHMVFDPLDWSHKQFSAQ